MEQQKSEIESRLKSEIKHLDELVVESEYQMKIMQVELEQKSNDMRSLNLRLSEANRMHRQSGNNSTANTPKRIKKKATAPSLSKANSKVSVYKMKTRNKQGQIPLSPKKVIVRSKSKQNLPPAHGENSLKRNVVKEKNGTIKGAKREDSPQQLEEYVH